MVLQPPITEHYTLLVDNINVTETFAHTTDLQKCEYNRQIIEDMGGDIDFQIQVKTALSKNGVTGVLPLGRYIVIIKSSKDELSQEMFFFDGFIKVDITDTFSKAVASEFDRVREQWELRFTKNDDLVRLLLSEK